MNYCICDDCVILDICGKEGCCDDAMTFCSDKHRFIHKSVIEDIKAEIEQVLESLSDGGDDWFTAEKVNECIDIIDKYMRGTNNE